MHEGVGRPEEVCFWYADDGHTMTTASHDVIPSTARTGGYQVPADEILPHMNKSTVAC